MDGQRRNDDDGAADGTDGQRTTTATTGHDGTDGQRTNDADRTDDGTNGRTEDDDGTDTTARTDDIYIVPIFYIYSMFHCIGHETTILDTHSKIPPDSSIYKS